MTGVASAECSSESVRAVVFFAFLSGALLGMFAPWIVPTEKSSVKRNATLGSTYAFVFFVPSFAVPALMISFAQSWSSNSAMAASSDYAPGEVTVWVIESHKHLLTSCKRAW